MLNRFTNWLSAPVSIAPLAMFRVLFGLVMLVSILRFMVLGWVDALYVAPQFHFTYFGFEWVQPLGAIGMYLLYGGMALAALMIALGLWYRYASVAFFLAFTYSELLDKANYLNHYYFVSIIAFLLILAPAHRYFSLDVLRKPSLKTDTAPRWAIGMIRLQLGMVYFFAGIAKLHPDWLFEAMPMRIWLPAKDNLPFIGDLFKYPLTAFVFSWAGALYDLSIPFLLAFRKTRPLAYAAVIGFHLMTWWLFQIGMFPFIMILATLIFFEGSFHQRIIDFFGKLWGRGRSLPPNAGLAGTGFARAGKLALVILAIHFSLQLVLPFRYALYPDSLFWTEEGYRFSWRVMLMEKGGYATFYVGETGNEAELEVDASDYLTPHQEKMMATQPDMILQFAHFLESEYLRQGWEDPRVRAEVYVSLNGRGSKLFIDPKIDLTTLKDGFLHKNWVKPYPYRTQLLAEQ